MKAAKRNDTPTELMEQKMLFDWANKEKLDVLVHIPNEGMRNPKTGYILKLVGMKKGFPDVMLPVPCQGYHGLFIEMKRIKGSRVSDEQKDWISKLSGQGYKCVIAYGHEEAIKAVKDYLLWFD